LIERPDLIARSFLQKKRPQRCPNFRPNPCLPRPHRGCLPAAAVVGARGRPGKEGAGLAGGRGRVAGRRLRTRPAGGRDGCACASSVKEAANSASSKEAAGASSEARDGESTARPRERGACRRGMALGRCGRRVGCCGRREGGASGAASGASGAAAGAFCLGCQRLGKKRRDFDENWR
jgi:hypothetical protein